MLTGLTLALGGASPPILDKMLFPSPILPPKSMFPPVLLKAITTKQNIRIELLFDVYIRTVNSLNDHIGNSLIFFTLFWVDEQIWHLTFLYFNYVSIWELITDLLSCLNSFLPTSLRK